jgi:DivIVA domain-containing protein
MVLTPQEVASKVFGPTRMRRGYDENEVDAFLDQVEAELTRLTTENERLRHELELSGNGAAVERVSSTPAVEAADPLVKTPDAAPAAPAAVEPAPPAAVQPAPAAAVEPVAPTVSTAAAVSTAADDTALEQRVARMLVLAQQTADAAIREAQTDADRTRGSARVEAERVLSEARSRAAEEIGILERSKAGLETQIEHLQTFEREYRQRLRAYLEVQLQDLESGKSGLPSLEGPDKHLGELGSAGGSGSGGQNSGEPGAGLSDPPGFGRVWSPGGAGTPGGDPLVATPADQESQGGVSPFDTGSEGHHNGG